jgi:chemotaxis protein MotB
MIDRGHSQADSNTTGASGAWMIIFADLVALLLTFFVMLFAMSKVEKDKWEQVVDALSLRLRPSVEAIDARPAAYINVPILDRTKAIDLDYLATILEDKMAANEILTGSRIRRRADRLVISLPTDLLFTLSSAALAPRAGEALFLLGGVLANIANRIDVGGHTDPLPVRGGAYASNWELSLARSVAVAEELRKSGYLREIAAFGYADSRFEELPSGLPEERRYALARRVDVIVRRTKEGP